jgi:hypothetical protein
MDISGSSCRGDLGGATPHLPEARASSDQVEAVASGGSPRVSTDKDVLSHADAVAAGARGARSWELSRRRSRKQLGASVADSADYRNRRNISRVGVICGQP